MSSIIFLSEQEQLASLISKELAVHGLTVTHVSDTEQFIPTVTSDTPLLIIIDIAVKNNSGISFIEKLRNLPDDNLKNIPVIIGEETGNLLVISEALKLNISDYFVSSKLDLPQLVQKVFKNIPKSSGVSAPPTVVIKDDRKYLMLLIEDDRFLRDLAIQKFTSDDKISIITAMDGEQGMILAEKHIPQIILIDILLPGIDGFEVLKRIRSKPQFSRTIIVMLSNFGQREDIDKAMALGANQFFIKANYTLDEIVVEVHKLLNIR